MRGPESSGVARHPGAQDERPRRTLASQVIARGGRWCIFVVGGVWAGALLVAHPGSQVASRTGTRREPAIGKPEIGIVNQRMFSWTRTPSRLTPSSRR